MQRYLGGGCTSAVNNNAIGGTSVTSRADSSAVPPHFSVNSRRQPQLTAYKLRCEKEPLNSRLGPPDFHPQTPHCNEETLTKEYVQSGYRETVEGLEETREISLSQVQSFTKPVIIKCKEAIKKYHRAINETRAQKRKAGQVYGVPLSGTLLTKPGTFPEQKPCGEDFRKKWIEGLSQQHKRLRSLADHVPHGHRKKSLFEILIRNDVPLLRATWFIKVTYLNQVRPGPSNTSSGLHDKTKSSRSEQWTKDVIDYLQSLLDEFLTRNNSHSNLHIRDRSLQMVYSSMLQKTDSLSAVSDGEEPSLYTKWWYVMRIIQWHHAEGLLVPSLIIDWVLYQLQEKELLGVLQLLMPIIYGVIETVVLSQTYVRSLVDVAVRFIREPSPGGSDLVDNSRRAYTTSALVEMLRYLILAVPDTFVALDCFPLPTCVMNNVVNDGNFLSKIVEDARKTKDGPLEVTGALSYRRDYVRAESLSIDHVVSSIQKRSEVLARAAVPDHPPGQNVARAAQELDKALMHGDIRVAYKLLYENTWDETVAESWISQVSPCLHLALKHFGTMTSSLICSTFFICEWATCDFRDFRTAPPHGLKFTGRKDFSQIHIAIRLLRLKMNEMQNLNSLEMKKKDFSDIFESPSSLHDIVLCWIDQHEMHNGEGFKRLQFLVRELICAGIFYPQAYVRQLIVSGIFDEHGPMINLERRKRHSKILKQLPGPYVCYALEEAQIAEPSVLTEVINVYSNERRLLLRGLLDHSKTRRRKGLGKKIKQRLHFGGGYASASSFDQLPFQSVSSIPQKNVDVEIKVEELKASIAFLLQLPGSVLPTHAGVNESQGSTKRPSSRVNNRADFTEETPGCEECRRVKRLRLSEEQNSHMQIYLTEEEESWWVRKGLKSLDSFKADPPPKPAKQGPRGRQKTVRKTQSLAQLAAARIEGSQGASTSHVCESKVDCPHHRTGFEDVTKSTGGVGSGDVYSIGKLLKEMRFVEKRMIALWLISTVKQLVEGTEKAMAKAGQYGKPFPAVDDRSPFSWKLGEDELSTILYLLDLSNELVSAVRFLLWLLPKLSSTPILSGRNIVMLRNAENHACEVGEAFLLSCIRRYENIMVAADLVPETLSAAMRRATTVMGSSGKSYSSPALVYARDLLKKYSNVASVVEWEKNLSKLESRRFLEGDFGFPLGAPSGVEDLDDYFRQKISSVRVSRVGLSMKDVVQRHTDEAFQYFYTKDRKLFGPGGNKSHSTEKWDDGYQIAQQIVVGLTDCMRQTGGAAQEGDPSLVSSAVAAIVNNVGQVIAKIPDVTTSNNHLNVPLASSSMHFARRLLRIHISCLCILKEALGERQARVFDVALATEASSALVQASTPGKAPRNQFQMSPESHDSSQNLPNDFLNHSTKAVLGRAAKITAAVSALVIGAILQGVVSLERIVTLFRLKEGLDLVQFVRSVKPIPNGNARSVGLLKLDNLVEVSVHWFRVLISNCRTVSDGFIVDLLGEPSIVALSRMQRMLPLSLVFPPAYSIFAFVRWRPFILNAGSGVRDDMQSLYLSMSLAMDDAVKHLPFREICLRDTHGLYELVAVDNMDSEFVSVLESNGSDINMKAAAFVPLRARLFLEALVDCKMPHVSKQDEGILVYGQGETKHQRAENVKRLLDKLVYVLDMLQPARFHWQWVQLRLLLNELAVMEKMENHDTSLVEAIRSLSSNPDHISDNEGNFIQIILTRLLVRPDAAPLFSELVHLLGRSLEDSMLLQAKWLLRGSDVLYGRKSIRQKIINNIVEPKKLSLKAQYWKPWGWCHSGVNQVKTKDDKLKSEAASIEEGEVVDERTDYDHSGKVADQVLDIEGFILTQQHVTERAFVELVLPCVDQGSDDSRNTFASEMIKQIVNIEQQISSLTRGATKLSETTGMGSPAGKSNSRKGGKGNSPALPKQSTGYAETVPPLPAALRASLNLRLQFLLRLLPIICVDREPSGRNMRCTLASVILRLLGSRVVHEDASHFMNTTLVPLKREVELPLAAAAASSLPSGEGLFEVLLLMLHVLLSSCQPSWLKLKSSPKSTEYAKDFAGFDREVAESLQNELDHMEMPEIIRWRIQTAMPIVFSSVRLSISCQPPSISTSALSFLQPSNPVNALNHSNPNLQHRNPSLPARASASVKTKQQPLQLDPDMEIDPWTLLEDAAGSGQPSANSAVVGGNDRANMKASSWLKGAVRVRRTDLTYIGPVDEDS